MSGEPQATMDSIAPNGWHWSLLRGFRAGTREALREIYRMHADEVARHLRHGFAFSSAGRHHRFVGYASAFELHDALHETFVRAFEPRARERYDGIRPYGPYLKAIARNIVLRTFRVREVLFPSLEGDPDAPPSTVAADSGSPSPEQLVAREQVRELVQGFLDTLTPDDRRLLQLRFIEAKSQREVATAMNLGRQQVRGREEKLRKRLVRYLQSRGETGLVGHVAALPLWIAWLLLGEAWP